MLLGRNFTKFHSSAHSPNFPSLHLRHNSFTNPSVPLPTSQLILQPSFRFSYVTSSSLNSPGEPPMQVRDPEIPITLHPLPSSGNFKTKCMHEVQYTVFQDSNISTVLSRGSANTMWSQFEVSWLTLFTTETEGIFSIVQSNIYPAGISEHAANYTRHA